MTKDEALKMALGFIERVNQDGWILADFEPQMYSTIAALKEALAQRPWVGLTPEEIKHLYPYGRSVWGKETYEAIEKALREKNDH